MNETEESPAPPASVETAAQPQHEPQADNGDELGLAPAERAEIAAQIESQEQPGERPGLRLLSSELSEPEPWWKRRLFELLALGIAAGFLFVMLSYWAPADGGIDMNGYLVGGKRLALTGSTGMKPDNPFQYVGGMWVMIGEPNPDAGTNWYYPKYPIGLPLLDAIPLWINWEHGKAWALYISPVCASLSLLAMFLLTRAIAGSFMGILGMMLLGVNYSTLVLSQMAWSHGPALFFVTWGMYLLLRWWQTGSIWRGLLAGFLLGYAVTIRYTEGLLLLPMLVITLLSIRWRHWSTYRRAIVPLVAWAVPVLWLVGFNWFAMHSITGYDTTNESTGFKWERFPDNWEFMFHELYDYGTFLVLPLAMLGLLVMWRWSWRVAMLIVLWLVPSTVVYTIYYWGSNLSGIAFLRFFQTLFPPIILAAVWFLRNASWCRTLTPSPGTGDLAQREGTGRGEGSSPNESDLLNQQNPHPPLSRNTGRGYAGGAIAMPIAAGALVTFSLLISVRNAVPFMERELAIRANLDLTCRAIEQSAPKNSVLIVDQNAWIGGILNFMQWRGDYELYSADAFRKMAIMMRFQVDANRPSPIQSARQTYAGKLYDKLDSNELQKKQDEVIDAALKQGRRAFCVLPVDKGTSKFFHRTINPGPGFEGKVIAKWSEPAAVENPRPRPLAPPERAWGWMKQPDTWQLVEIVRKPPTPPAPATAPAAAAAAATAPTSQSMNDGSDD